MVGQNDNLNMTKNIEDELMELEELLRDETIKNNLTDIIPNNDDNLLEDISAIDMNSFLDVAANASGFSNLKTNRSLMANVKSEEYVPSTIRFSNNHYNNTANRAGSRIVTENQTPIKEFAYVKGSSSHRRSSTNLTGNGQKSRALETAENDRHFFNENSIENSMSSARGRTITRSVSQPRVSIMERVKIPPAQKEENYSFRPMLSKRSLKIAANLVERNYLN